MFWVGREQSCFMNIGLDKSSPFLKLSSNDCSVLIPTMLMFRVKNTMWETSWPFEDGSVD